MTLILPWENAEIHTNNPIYRSKHIRMEFKGRMRAIIVETTISFDWTVYPSITRNVIKGTAATLEEAKIQADQNLEILGYKLVSNDLKVML